MKNKTEQIVKKKKETPTKEEIKEGGTFTLTPHDLETLSAEFTEINNIFSLAKADDGVKAILFNEFRRDFGEDFLCFIGEQKLLTEKKIEDLITAVEENMEVERCRNENCEAYPILPTEKRKELIAWAKVL